MCKGRVLLNESLGPKDIKRVIYASTSDLSISAFPPLLALRVVAIRVLSNALEPFDFRRSP